ncbi:MAG: molybdenum cofactor biosynthesis protein B [Candidatus Thiodiazotropha sp. (ex Lucinoma aequizonata)]|nr:molybdenum cofactor biosynthesis protein B [Candidatus Thiodiazotropha sp. (ex Lucinoma aequizonata)]MCU7889733.1 molybdenum cofactor biosynthesis protein B [Candidatus Thiodiazotropha sp. (ex Lucinoma aequizonata)]MCU7895787.1 molybdenum cofactor biosynthesis protein B [Candidatus Thiodiazotropha sp. (ex Lucinoma aequizonata)]MCU7899568.1 molybdenum cofactor biosynthesis protein B [Candidatus Thiodiazotropha sp. (ex Lucinoma aequizonata)]MCU7901531.1 molybdenum cofactor biosynthesis protein
MSGYFKETEFVPLNLAVLTVSDSRTEETDKSGLILKERALKAGHHVVEKSIVPDDIYQMRAIVSRWIADTKVHVIVSTGGTGITGRDSTPEALLPLFDKLIEGFGELYRRISLEEIGTSSIQSRAISGLANGTLIFCLPGSTGACHTGWEKILKSQLDMRTRPCNFAQMFPRLLEV